MKFNNTVEVSRASTKSYAQDAVMNGLLAGELWLGESLGYRVGTG